ncbi:hypothetical protein ACFV1N_47465 [Streptosporangium canum]|uniref:hypothetical protein n=1 Tax=Streptosporangium canum TaxID=324952 RepID=UPI0036B90BE6
MSIVEPSTAFAQDVPQAEQVRTRLEAAAQVDCGPYATRHPSLNYVDSFRALRDAQVANGHAVLAVQAELAQTREAMVAGLAGLIQAVRELTQTIGAATEPLPVVVNRMTGIAAGIGTLDRGLTEIAEAVDELTEELQQRRRRRRSWRERLLGRRTAEDRQEVGA